MTLPESDTLAPMGGALADDAEQALALRDPNVELTVRQIVAALEEDIVFGYLHPRERLVEDDLRARFNAKRHVVRQVLIELEQMGLVERKKNIGAFVKAYSIKEVIDLYVVRDILEKSGARQIIMPVPISDIDALTAIQHQHDTAVSERSLRHAFRANIAFHKALFALSNNPTLTDAIEDFAQRAHIVRSLSMTTPYFLEKARRDHWLIIEALKQGDKEGLIKVCHDHLQPSLDAYIEQYRQRMGQEP